MGSRAQRSRRAQHAGLAWIVVSVGLLMLTAFLYPPSNSPTRLILDAGLLSRLRVLAAGLHTEIVLCLTGSDNGTTVLASGFVMPDPELSTPEHATFGSCPSGTLAIWHNHPVEGPPADLNADPRDLCALSELDIRTAVRQSAPFVVVAVDGGTWCWWSQDQVRKLAAQKLLRGDPLTGQIESLTRTRTDPH